MLCSEALNAEHQMLREGQELLLLLAVSYCQGTQHHLTVAAELTQRAQIYKPTATLLFLTEQFFARLGS